VTFSQFPNDEARQRNNNHGERARKDWGCKPIEVIALIQNGLRPEENEGEQKEAYAVKARDATSKAAPIKQRSGHCRDGQSNDDIRVEKGAPCGAPSSCRFLIAR
jgi:hypothetical protein